MNARCIVSHSKYGRCALDDGHEGKHRPWPAHRECHATGCARLVPPRLLMCGRHWKMVPRPLQQRVWFAYVEGQELRRDPTDAYLEAVRAAVEAVAAKERAA